MENRKTVVLADANEEFRGMLREVVEKTDRFSVVGCTGDGTEALELIERLKPDLAVVDLVRLWEARCSKRLLSMAIRQFM